jgi:hypothetical protein
MALPNGIEPKPREKWIELGNSPDPAQRKQVTDVLRALGMASPDYMPLSTEERVAIIMKHQGEVAPTPEAKASSGGSKKDAVSKTDGGKVESGGGGGLTAADRAILKEVSEKLDKSIALQRKIHDLLVVQIFSDPKVKANAEDMDIKVELLGNG